MANLILEWWKEQPKQIVENFIEHCQRKQESLKKFSMDIENKIVSDRALLKAYFDSVKETSGKCSRKVTDGILKQRNRFFKIMVKSYKFNTYLKLQEFQSAVDSAIWLVEQYADSEQVLNDIYGLFETKPNQLVEDNVRQVIEACTLVEKLDVLSVDLYKNFEKNQEEKMQIVGQLTGFVDSYIDILDNNDYQYSKLISLDY